MKVKVSIILPARNEEGLIQHTVLDIFEYLKRNKKYAFEILVVINGSNDKTEDIVKDLGSRHKEIRLIHSKAGYSYALRKGLREAGGRYLIIYNVDFYDLRLIDLVDIDMYGKDLIIGSKRTYWSKDTRPQKRKLVTVFFNLYLKLVHGFRGSDTHGIKLIKKDVIKEVLPRCKTNSGIFDTELVIKVQRADYKIADFPVVVEEKRPSRFMDRLLSTPEDIIQLYFSLKDEK